MCQFNCYVITLGHASLVLITFATSEGSDYTQQHNLTRTTAHTIDTLIVFLKEFFEKLMQMATKAC